MLFGDVVFTEENLKKQQLVAKPTKNQKLLLRVILQLVWLCLSLNVTYVNVLLCWYAYSTHFNLRVEDGAFLFTIFALLQLFVS